MEKLDDRHAGSESKTRLTDRVNACLRSGDYSRALDLLRGRAAEFPDDADLSELETRAQEGVKRKEEADRLITQSQELFAQRKPADAIQLLREAYELDKNNSLARAILANALVEHAQSVVESDWLQAETLANQALKLNPAHPTAKTIQNLIVEQKQNSSVEDWVARARKLQSSGDLFAALAWVAEGLAVHPDDPRLSQLQDAIQRDQSARRRQARRTDLEELQRLQREIGGATDVAAKQTLAGRIQAIAAKYWTDGEILSIANALLLRLGLVPQGNSAASPQSKGAAVIFHVPRPSAPETLRVDTDQVVPSPASPKQSPPKTIPGAAVSAGTIAAGSAPAKVVRAEKAAAAPPTPQNGPPPAGSISVDLSPTTVKASPSRSRAQTHVRSNSTTLIAVSVSSVAAIILMAAIFLVARKRPASPEARPSSLASSAPAQATTASSDTAPTPSPSAAAQPVPESLPPASDIPTDTANNVLPDNVPPAESASNAGTLVVVAGQEGARVFLNGKPQRKLTQSGQLLIANLAPNDYVVQVSKTGFQDPPSQKIHIRTGERDRLTFNLQPKPLLASLMIQGGFPGTAVLIDQAPVGTIQPNGTLSVSTVNPGDHMVELRKERFTPRLFKKHFVASGTTTLAGADAVLEAAPGELKITFSPSNANVAIAKGDLLKIVSSGIPLNLAAGSYTLTARTAERFTRSATLEVVAGQSRTLDLALAPNGMSKWDEPGAWKQERDGFVRKGGDFVLYGVVPTSGTIVFSAMAKGRLLQWVLNYTDTKDYILCQMDDRNFYRSVIRNGQKADEIIVPHKGDRKSFRSFQIHISRSEIVHEIKDGERWTVLDRWTEPGANLSQGKFGFSLPGNEQLELSSFAHYADLSIR